MARQDNIHHITHAILGSQYFGPVEDLLNMPPSFSNGRRSVLELGCGTGAWTRDMARMFKHVDFVGIDILPVPPPAGRPPPTFLEQLGVSSDDNEWDIDHFETNANGPGLLRPSALLTTNRETESESDDDSSYAADDWGTIPPATDTTHRSSAFAADRSRMRLAPHTTDRNNGVSRR